MKLTLIVCSLCNSVQANATAGRTVEQTAAAFGWELATQYRKSEVDLCPSCANRVAEGRRRAAAKEGTVSDAK